MGGAHGDGGGGSGGAGSRPDAAAADAPALVVVEDWQDVRPHLSEWVRAGQPSAEPLLEYAQALFAAWRLEELGFLCGFLARACRPARAEWDGVLRHFAAEVDRMVVAKYGGHFGPLRAIEELLALP